MSSMADIARLAVESEDWEWMAGMVAVDEDGERWRLLAYNGGWEAHHVGFDATCWADIGYCDGYVPDLEDWATVGLLVGQQEESRTATAALWEVAVRQVDEAIGREAAAIRELEVAKTALRQLTGGTEVLVQLDAARDERARCARLLREAADRVLGPDRRTP